MADTPRDKGLDEAFAHMKERVAQEVEAHKDEDVSLEDLENVSGGWSITYNTSQQN
jgi:hypothetical protein